MTTKFENLDLTIESISDSKISFKESNSVPQGSVEKDKDGAVFAFVEFIPNTKDDIKHSIMRFCDSKGKELKSATIDIKEKAR